MVGVVALACSLAGMRHCSTSERPWFACLVVALFVAVMTYWMGLGTETPGLLLTRHVIGPWVAFPLLILMAAAGAALPVVALVGLARLLGSSAPLVRRGTAPPARIDARPVLLMAAVVAVTTAIGLAVFLGAMAVTFSMPGWGPFPLFAIGFGLPFVLAPIGAAAYRALLMRWSVPVPAALTLGLNRLREETRFTFARVMCLDAAFANGRSCFVIVAHFNVTFVVSAAIVQRLTADELFAVLAHEAAHVHFHHGRRKLLWGVVAAVCCAGGLFILNQVTFALLPPSAGFVRLLVSMMPLLFLRSLYDLRVTRRHEAEADEYAVAVAGAAPLISALETLGATAQRQRWTHNRWTTHGTWEERSARIRAKG